MMRDVSVGAELRRWQGLRSISACVCVLEMLTSPAHENLPEATTGHCCGDFRLFRVAVRVVCVAMGA